MPNPLQQAIELFTTIAGTTDTGTSGSAVGGSSGSGVDTSPQDSQPTTGGGNIQVRLFLRQAKSSNAEKIKIQIRAYFFYAPYSSENTATLRAWWGTSPSGSAQITEIWGWNRVLSHNENDRKVFSEWFTIGEVNNTKSPIAVYVTCQPSTSYPEVGYQLYLNNARPSHWLNVTPDNNVKSHKYTITDGSGVYGSNRTNISDHYAIVYDGDVVTWSATPKSGYKIDPKDAHIESPGGTQIPGASTITVRAYTYIRIIAKAMATLRMKIAGIWNMYSIYVRRGGAWVQHQAHIRSSNKWDQYS